MDDSTNGTGIERVTVDVPNAWTGGQKAGWFFVALLGGIPGVLIASLANVSHPDRSTATKMALVGLAARFVIFVLFFFMMECSTPMPISGGASAYH